jgi:hypothetical protein
MFSTLDRTQAALAHNLTLGLPSQVAPVMTRTEDRRCLKLTWAVDGVVVAEISIRFWWNGRVYRANVSSRHPAGTPDKYSEIRRVAANTATYLHGVCSHWTVVPDRLANLSA